MGKTSEQRAIANDRNRRGGILEALLASPLIGSDLDLTRSREEGRTVDLFDTDNERDFVGIEIINPLRGPTG